MLKLMSSIFVMMVMVVGWFFLSYRLDGVAVAVAFGDVGEGRGVAAVVVVTDALAEVESEWPHWLLAFGAEDGWCWIWPHHDRNC